MARGGARNRSGPPPNPNSGRSERRGFSLTALPNEGYDGDPPDWMLADLPEELLAVTMRETRVWAEAWRSPQAAAWAREPWRWPVVAEYCRVKASLEVTAGANAALVGQLHRYRDQLGLTPAGLKENGWAIAAPEIEPAKVDDEDDAAVEPARPKSSRDRLSVVGG